MGNACCSDGRNSDGQHGQYFDKSKIYADGNLSESMHAPGLDVAFKVDQNEMEQAIKTVLHLHEKYLPDECRNFLDVLKDQVKNNASIIGPYQYKTKNEKYLGNYQNGLREG